MKPARLPPSSRFGALSVSSCSRWAPCASMRHPRRRCLSPLRAASVHGADRQGGRAFLPTFSTTDSMDQDERETTRTYTQLSRMLHPTASASASSDDEAPHDAHARASSSSSHLARIFTHRDILTLGYAVLIGGLVAASVFTFDCSIDLIHDLPDTLHDFLSGGGGALPEGLQLPLGLFLPYSLVMPVIAGSAVAWLQSLGFAPPLKVTTKCLESVQDDVRRVSLPSDYGQVFRKAAASAITLGGGASLGPEAPSVELGANTAAVITPKSLSRRRQRMLLAAGAAAGVSAAFDAPVAGALFAVEFVLKSSRMGLDRLSTATVFVSTSMASGVVGFLRMHGQALGIKGAASHLVGRIPYYSTHPHMLYDVFMFGLLGVGCASAAVALYEGVRLSEIFLRPLPRKVSAPLAGGLCGIIALYFPQVQYGYVNLEEIFRDSLVHRPLGSLVSLLVAKIAATSICVGGGLVGGLFAPSLFLGALVGDILGHTFADAGAVADANTFMVVGGAAVLGASCRAPLTAITLMVEITRDTGLLVPLLAAIGTASLVTDYVEGAFSRWLEAKLVEMYLQEKSMFWGAGLVEGMPGHSTPLDAVEGAMSVTTDLYVRHSLPLAQAREAMASKGVKAAVVVDDDLCPMGIAYFADVEEEIVRRRERGGDRDGSLFVSGG